MKNYIIPFSVGGLAGRLRCLITSINISLYTKREILLYWPKNPPCNCYFSDLFENDLKEISKEELRKILKKKEFQILKDDRDIKQKKKFILIGDLGFVGFANKSQIQRFEKMPENVRKEICAILKKLKIKKEIQEKANKFYKKYLNRNVIGIHMRKGDFRIIANHVGKVSSDEKFIEEIEKEIKINTKAKFLLATEEKETEEKFKRIFKNRIISYPKETKKREEEGAVKEALIELLLLSKCKKIFGSFGSTFTEFAWFFGECKPEIKIIMERREFEIYKEKEKMKKSFIKKIKKIVYEIIVPLHVRILDKI